MLADLNDFLSPLLRRLDRTSMGASEECRVPFLDHRLVHKAINLPVEYRIGKRANKWVLKQVAERYMPHHLVHRRRRGSPSRWPTTWRPTRCGASSPADSARPSWASTGGASSGCCATGGARPRGCSRWSPSRSGDGSHIRGESLEAVEAWMAGFEPRPSDAARPSPRRPEAAAPAASPGADR